MLRQSLVASFLAGVVLSTTQASAESSTIRIEPRPYYGAVVTVEQGVRVWRPLPPTRHMIINPTGAPVSVNVTDVRETVSHHGPVYAAPTGNYAAATAGGAGPAYFVGRRPYYRGGRTVHRRR